MDPHESERLLTEFGLRARQAPDLFRSAAEVAAQRPNGYAHVLRRAWKSFDGLFAVLSVEGRPTIFFQEGSTDTQITLTEQRRFWSHGVAPILVRVTTQEVQVYSGLRSPALKQEDVDKNERLVDVFSRTADALEVRELIRAAEAGTLYQRYAKHFDPAQAVDQQLIGNLRATRERISVGEDAPDLPTTHRILGRILFTCYLEARGALVPKDFGRLGAGAKATFRQLFSLDPESVRNALKRLFRLLARYFRGNLFDDSLAQDISALRDKDIAALHDLIVGNNVASGQLVLPFDSYDFSVIPIETISAVYEDFIRAESSEAQRRKGAYYTPPKLVQFTFDLATEDNPDLGRKRVLDPGCGSGVFLVSAFNRFAEAWIHANSRATNGKRTRALAKILQDQICGVDLNLIACQASCFSLYMAMLDFLDPREIRSLGPERLPSLFLPAGEKRRPNGPRTIIHGDFLSGLASLDGQRFDLIIGNPPWVARGNVEDGDNIDEGAEDENPSSAEENASMANWESRRAADHLPTPARQIACAFMWEIPQYLGSHGKACLLLPASVLLANRADAFQAQWFARYRVEKIAQLADLRFFLFPGAIHPTIALRFCATAPEPGARVAYITPKANHASLRDNVIVVEPDDHKWVPLAEILASARESKAASCWLSYNWASPRDRELLTRLRALPALDALVGEPKEKRRWKKGQGIMPRGRDSGRYEPFWKPTAPFLASRQGFNLLLGLRETKPIGDRFRKPHRVRDEQLFKTPLVVFNQGFSKVAFSPFDVIFQHALQSIAGPDEDRELLMFLTATLASPLARYLAFHLTTKPYYRGKSHLNEVLRFPFPLPEDAPSDDAKGAVHAVAQIFSQMGNDWRFEAFGHDQLIAETQEDLKPHVYSYFGVTSDEQVLIEDTIAVLERSVTPHRGSKPPTLAPSTMESRKTYAATLVDALRAWAGGGIDLGASCIVSEAAGVAVLTVGKVSELDQYTEIGASIELEHVLARLLKLAPERYGSLVYLRNLAILEGEKVHIVKPLTMRFWLRSAALNDADAVAARLLFGSSGSAPA